MFPVKAAQKHGPGWALEWFGFPKPESLQEQRVTVPEIAVRPRALRSLRAEAWNDPPPGSGEKPEESPDQKPPFLAPDSEPKISPSPKSREPLSLGQRTVR